MKSWASERGLMHQKQKKGFMIHEVAFKIHRRNCPKFPISNLSFVFFRLKLKLLLVSSETKEIANEARWLAC